MPPTKQSQNLIYQGRNRQQSLKQMGPYSAFHLKTSFMEVAERLTPQRLSFLDRERSFPSPIPKFLCKYPYSKLGEPLPEAEKTPTVMQGKLHWRRKEWLSVVKTSERLNLAWVPKRSIPQPDKAWPAAGLISSRYAGPQAGGVKQGQHT